MAGKITVSTINDSSGVLATQNGMTGIAKAWINYNGQTSTINNSFNVSSVTKNGTGDYTFNITTAMPSANYSAVGSCWYQTGSYGVFMNSRYGTQTASACRVLCSTAGAVYDCVEVNVAIYA